ncbi:MAG: hypothetical protein COA36_03080 [Desulfotalea sp.]|nr:MAG: hypothetical protein COA36_03080 [Desulfotalea sp.]
MMFICLKRIGLTLMPCVLGLVCIFMLPHESVGHALDYRILEAKETPAIDFHYSDGSPASYTAVKIWSPDNGTIEFLNGRTDKNGRISFLPDVDGVWRITINDGMGHVKTLQYEVDGSTGNVVAKNQNEQHNSRLLLAILGCSLILNLGFLLKRVARKDGSWFK